MDALLGWLGLNDKKGGQVRMITRAELATHSNAGSAWLAIKGEVYDLTTYLKEHPGGSKVLLACCGKEADEAYELFHGHTNYIRRLKGLRIGKLG